MTTKKKRDELLERKQYLLNEKASILKDIDAGTGDTFSLFFINEELGDINAQLRSMKKGSKAKKSRTTSTDSFEVDRKQYTDWFQEQYDDDHTNKKQHKILLDTISEAEGLLTESQAKAYKLWSGGVNIQSIANSLNVDKSTISRTISRAKKAIKEEAERRLQLLELDRKNDYLYVDLSDERIMRLTLSCLTPHQAICIYLYYGEWLTMRECASLLNIDHSTICRTLQRGMASLTNFYGRCAVLDNVDEIGEFAYQEFIYNYNGIPAIYADEAKKLSDKPKKCWAYKTLFKEERKEQVEKKPVPVMQNSAGDSSSSEKQHGIVDKKQYGKLLRTIIAEQERYKEEKGIKATFFNWLVTIFGKFTKQL